MYFVGLKILIVQYLFCSQEKGMTVKGKRPNRESSSSKLDSQEPRMDIKSILKDIEFLGKIKSLYIYYFYNPIY